MGETGNATGGGRTRLMVLALILLAAGGYFYYWKYMPKTPAEKRVVAEKKAWDRISAARGKSYEEAREKAKAAWEKARQRLEFTSEERFPLADEATLLSSPPPLPHSAAPVVFLAPLAPVNTSSPPASENGTRILNDVLRFQLRAAPRDRLVINLVPQRFMILPHDRQGVNDPLKGRTPEQFLQDALDLGSDYFIYGQAGTTAGGDMVVRLGMVEIQTSRTVTFEQTQPPARVGDLLRASLQAAAGFVGLTPEQMDNAGITRGIPANPETLQFAALGSDDDVTADQVREVAAADPDCPYVYETLLWKGLGDDLLPLLNEALKRWPDDPRLILTKVSACSAAGNALMAAELMRRYPGALSANVAALDTVEPLLNSSQAPDVLEHLKAYEAYLDECVRRRPGDWATRWQRAWVTGLCASHVPMRALLQHEERPEDTVIQKIEEESKAYAATAMQEMEVAAALRPDCSRLQLDLLRFRVGKGDVPHDQLLALARSIARLDPRSVEAEYVVMEHLADEPRLQTFIAEEAIARAKKENDAVAMTRVMSPLIGNMREAIGWMRKDENLAALKEHPAVPVFVDAAEHIMNQGKKPLYSGQVDLLVRIYRARGEEAKVQRVSTYMQEVWTKTQKAHDAGEWQTCYDYASATWEASSGNRERQLYYVVKSLWKLKRYREALRRAEEGIQMLPKRPTFHYMFAVVALEANVRLEEAYAHIALAAPMDGSNTGMQETLAKLGKKLGKPTKI